MSRFFAMLAALSLTVPAHTQSVHAVHLVGQRDLAWTNPTGRGSPFLFSRVLYPSTTGGVDAPIEPSANGWPVIVFLHGYAILGRDYVELASHWVSSGFAVVLVDSSMFAFFDEADDAVAHYSAILAANRDPGTFFDRAFDTRRIGIAGHSMGGGAMALALAKNPGYCCAFALAPAWPGTSWTNQVTVPMAIAVGDGDAITPWYLHAFPYYQSLMPRSGLKTWYLLDGECDHMNIVGLAGAQDPAFARTADLTVGFFRHFLDIDPSGLDRCLGPCVANAQQLLMHDTAIVQPRLWSDQPLAVGATVRISIATEGGPGAILAAPCIGQATPTSVGTLLLDPAHTFTWTTGVAPAGRWDAFLSVPNDPTLAGLTLALQGLGATVVDPLLFGSAAQFVVAP